MNRNIRGFFIPILILFLFPAIPLKAKNYEIEKVHIFAQINKDGSVNIREERTYNFHGSFSWANYILPKKKISGVENFTVSENGKFYDLSYSGKPGTYKFYDYPDRIEAKWYFEAFNERKTFVLSFKILDAVTVYEDIAEFYYKFIGSGWDRRTEEVKVEVSLPEPFSKNEIRAWAHGPLWGTVEIGEEGKIFLNINNLPANKFWEGRILFPPHLVPECMNRVDKNVLGKILVEEKRWAEEANLKRKKAQERVKYGAILSISLALFTFGIWIVMYLRYGKPHNVPFEGKFYSDIPSEKPPSFIEYILNKREIGATSLVSTILDLAQRGFLTIEEQSETKRGIFGTRKKTEYYLILNRDFYESNKGKLRDFEQSLIEFIFGDIAKGEGLILEGMTKMGDKISFTTIKKSRSKFIDWFKKWQKEIKKTAESEGFFEPKSVKMMKYFQGIVLSILFLSILEAFLLGEQGFTSVITFILVPIFYVLSISLLRHNPEIAMEVKKWKALKRYISEYEFRNEPGEDFFKKISKYLVYAVVLGLSTRKIKKLLKFVPEKYYEDSVPWYSFYTSGKNSFGSFSDAISSMISSISTTMSSASGTGGGASGGGGGGGGGSGGGAG